jgi:iron complex outermembrane receptor protein
MLRPFRAFGAAVILIPSVITGARAQEAQQLPAIDVSGEAGAAVPPAPVTAKEKYQLPQTSESVTAERIRETVNAVDTEDVLKYFPSLFLRKRNYGDNQAVLATRTTGVGASARSLVYADDILLSALIHNNNSIGAPRWALVSPEEIERVDFLYGPFSAAYPGNSIGGVVQITTKMPAKAEATIKQTEAFQTFDFYNTKKTLRTDQTSATFGNRWNDLSMFVSASYQRSDSQPIGWVTTTGIPAGTSGTIPALGRTGGVANVVGAGLLHTDQVNLKTKVAYDFTSNIRGAYTIGYWSNDQTATPQTYLRDGAGNPTYGGVAGFASNNYTWNEKHLAQSLSLKKDSGGTFDWDLSASRYDYLQDIQRLPFTVGAGTNFSPNGKIVRLDGTNWTNGDAKAIWRPDGVAKNHEISFGGHIDTYVLNSPTYATPTWNSGPDTTSSLYTSGQGKTQTTAVWLQDAWRFAPMFKLALGGRLENWRAFDGFVLNTIQDTNGNITARNASYQKGLSASPFSPKASLAFEPSKDWLATASIGVINRFPTVGELYQTSTGSGQVVLPAPALTPEHGISSEIALERRFTDGKVRLSLFEEDLRNALISQSTTVPGNTAVFTFVTNVDKARNRGAELAWQKDNVFIRRLEFFGSATYVDSRILSDPTFVSTTGTTAVGKRVPNIPMWRVTNGATWRPTEEWAFTVASRYSSKQYSTLDNTDFVSNVYQAFDSFFVVDTRVTYKLGKQASLEFGIDNINNKKYTLFHPFPQRTYVIGGRVTF